MAAERRTGETVLILDPSESFLFYLETILKRLGYDVLKSHSGKEGLQLVSSHKPEMVILEVDLEDINGLEVCRALRNGPETAQLPIVFISKDGASEKIEEARLNGCSDYLTKPVKLRSLHQVLEDHLHQQRRKLIRIPIAVNVEIVERDRKVTCETQSLGEGGMFLQTQKPYPLGTLLEFIVTLPDHPSPLRLKGEVIHCMPDTVGKGQCGMGIKFIDTVPEAASLLTSFIEKSLS